MDVLGYPAIYKNVTSLPILENTIFWRPVITVFDFIFFKHLFVVSYIFFGKYTLKYQVLFQRIIIRSIDDEIHIFQRCY